MKTAVTLSFLALVLWGNAVFAHSRLDVVVAALGTIPALIVLLVVLTSSATADDH